MQDQFTLAGLYLAKKAVPETGKDTLVNGVMLKQIMEPNYLPEGSINPSAYDESPPEEIGEVLMLLIYRRYLLISREWSEELADRVEREITLRAIDRNWTRHIDTMAH